MAVVRNPYAAGNDGPAERFVPVTASDTTYFSAGPCRGLLVGTGGNATILGCDDTPVAVVLTAGYNPLIVQRVNATGLTAANIVALY